MNSMPQRHHATPDELSARALARVVRMAERVLDGVEGRSCANCGFIRENVVEQAALTALNEALVAYPLAVIRRSGLMGGAA